MDLRESSHRDTLWTRLQALRTNGTSVSSSSFSPAAVVTAVRMLFDLYPREIRKDLELQDHILRAFVLTIIPGADARDPDMVRMYHDTDYPFYPYTGFLVYDLGRRSLRTYGTGAFHQLSAPERTSLLQDALSSDDTTSRLYRGAMLMAQVSYYAGIYDPDKGCSLIDFPGRNAGFSLSELAGKNVEAALGDEMTVDGNPP